MRYRIIDNSGLAFANYLGLLNGVVLEWTGQRHPVTNQLILLQPIAAGVVMMDDEHVELVNDENE